MTSPTGNPLDGGFDEPMGRYTYEVATHSWWWSDQMYAIHGFAPGEVVPTTALLHAHKHPDDFEYAVKALQTVLLEPTEYCCRYRIIDARRKVRTVVSLGQSLADADGTVVRIAGYFVDVTESERLHSQDAVHEAIEHSARSRAVIEQAKGAIMFSYNLTDGEAFTLLRKHSQHHNIKLRDLAAAMVDSFTHPDAAASTIPQKIAARLLHHGENAFSVGE